MSVQAMTWAWKQQLPMGPKAVLLAIANHADGEGVCYPGQARIADMVGCNDRSVRKFVKHLEDAGLIERRQRRRPDGSRTSDEYHLIGYQPANGAGSQPANGAGSDPKPTGKLCRTNRQSVPDQPANCAGHEPSVEPSVEPSGKSNVRAFNPKTVELPEHITRDAWTDYCQHRTELRKPLKPTSTRALLAKLQQHPRDANTMLRTSVEKGWTGVFPPDKPNHRRPTTTATAPDDYADVTPDDLLTPTNVSGRWSN